MNEGHLERLARQSGIPDLVEVLAERLAPADLTSLMLAVHRHKAAGLAPAKVLEAFERSRFSGVAPVDAVAMSEFDARWLSLLSQLGFEGVELSPVSPLGTIASVTSVDQNKVLTTNRNSEVLADSTTSARRVAVTTATCVFSSTLRQRETSSFC